MIPASNSLPTRSHLTLPRTVGRLELLLLAALPHLSPRGHALLQALVDDRGTAHTCTEFAASVGARNRTVLTRLLGHEGLPPYRRLLGLIQVLAWTVRWERIR